MLETTFDGRIESAEWIATVQPPNSPLPGFRIVGAQSNSPKFACRHLEEIFVHIRQAVHQRPNRLRAVEFDPFMTTRQPLLQTAMMGCPSAHPKVEGVGAGEIGALRGLGLAWQACEAAIDPAKAAIRRAARNITTISP